MISYQWSILETVIIDRELKSVKYWCKATDDKNSVETEGNWNMLTPNLVEDVISENHVEHWLDIDAIVNDKHII